MAAVGSLNKSMNKINSTGYLTYGRMPDYDVVLLMGNNSDMKSDFDQGDTFDNQRVHIDANYKFDVIPPEVDALLTAIAVVTECSKTWYFFKGTPEQIIKAGVGSGPISET